MYLPDLFAVDPGDRAPRWSAIAQLIEGWWSPLTPEDGTPPDEIRAAEARLGVALPAALREVYAAFGQREEIVNSFDRLSPPRHLRRSDGALVVWVSQGGVIEWCIREPDLSLPDPPTIVGQRRHGAWGEHPALPYEPSTSRFFVWKASSRRWTAPRRRPTPSRPAEPPGSDDPASNAPSRTAGEDAAPVDPPPSDDRATGSTSDLDPRLGLYFGR